MAVGIVSLFRIAQVVALYCISQVNSTAGFQDSGDVRHNEPSPPKGIHRHQIRREEEACCFAGYPRLVARTE